jgi:hypothetical protein
MSTPEGWYADPDAPGMVRWWDGQRWADMTMPQALAPQPASTGDKAVAVMGGAGKLMLLGLVFVVLLVLLVVAVLAFFV